MIEATHYLALSLVLLCLALMGMMMRRSFIAIMMSIQLGFCAVILNLAAFSYRLSDLQGQTLAAVVIAVAAVQAVVGFGLAVGFVRLKEASEADDADGPRG